LGEKVLLLLQLDDSSTKASVRKKGGQVECGFVLIGYQHETSFEAV
jgi:hypothetical protein